MCVCIGAPALSLSLACLLSPRSFAPHTTATKTTTTAGGGTKRTKGSSAAPPTTAQQLPQQPPKHGLHPLCTVLAAGDAPALRSLSLDGTHLGLDGARALARAMLGGGARGLLRLEGLSLVRCKVRVGMG